MARGRLTTPKQANQEISGNFRTISDKIRAEEFNDSGFGVRKSLEQVTADMG